MKSVIVTGGAGFIGSHIVDALLERDFKVYVIDDLSTGSRENLNSKAKFVKLDIRSPKLRQIVLKIKPEIIYHLAAQINVRKSVSEPIFDTEVNVLGSIRLLEAVRAVKVKKFIFSSSGGAIYGGAKKIPTPESYRASPFSPYGAAKLSFEHYLNCYNYLYNFPSVILRYSNVYGPRQSSKGEAGVVSIFIGKMIKGDCPIINGDGLQTRDYVYVGDVVKANMLAKQPKVSGVYNIGTGVETSVNKIFSELKDIIGVSCDMQHGPEKIGEEKRSAIDARKAWSDFGWRSQIKLEDGLKKTVEWFKKGYRF